MPLVRGRLIVPDLPAAAGVEREDSFGAVTYITPSDDDRRDLQPADVRESSSIHRGASRFTLSCRSASARYSDCRRARRCSRPVGLGRHLADPIAVLAQQVDAFVVRHQLQVVEALRHELSVQHLPVRRLHLHPNYGRGLRPPLDRAQERDESR